jgi:N12 class adenine-specific DNA methylase
VDLPGGQGHVSEYFTARPDMVLGQMRAGTGMYSNTELEVMGDRNATPALHAALERAVTDATAAGLVMTGPPATAPAPGPRPAAGAELMPDPMPGMIRAHKDGTFTRITDVYDDGATSEQPFQVPKTQAAELRCLLRLRDITRALIRAERDSADDTPEISGLRDKLNREYDSYVRLYGPVKRFKWGKLRTKPGQATGTDGDEADGQAEQETAPRVLPPQGGFRRDPYYHAVYALEKTYDPATGTAATQDIFTQRVIAPPQPLLGADTPDEALAICLSCSSM